MPRNATIEQRIGVIAAMHAAHMAKEERDAQRAEKRKERELQADERHWTDGRQFAEAAVGETFRATTGLDNDWGDY